MRRAMIFIMAIMAWGIALAQGNEWEYAGAGIKERDVRAVVVNPIEPSLMYAGTDRAVYRSEDGGKSWREALTLKGTYRAVNAIAIDRKNSNVAYVSTENGVFKTADLGKSWKKIFDGKGDFERDVRHIAVDPEESNSIYIATRAGIFSSNDAGATWQKAASLRADSVNRIAIRHMSPKVLFAAASPGVFLSRDNGTNWERIFVEYEASEAEASGEHDSDAAGDEAAASISGVNSIAFDPVEDKKIYLGTANGVYLSADNGTSWRKLSAAGLMNEGINDLMVARDGRLYAACRGGVFAYYPADERWEELYKGKEKASAKALAYAEKANALWGAFDVGLFRGYIDSSGARSRADEARRKLFAKINGEPTIREVQKVAMRYADCEPSKITLWRVGAQARAFMPKVKFGLDKSKSSNIEVDRGGTNDPDRFMDGPWEANRGWDASVEWDFGDMIWNPDQTNIDVRSRLTTQLRDDIMDDVTRSYFERKRLIFEFAQHPPADQKVKQEKELRIEELTANIDGLTGGYFSKEIAKREKY